MSEKYEKMTTRILGLSPEENYQGWLVICFLVILIGSLERIVFENMNGNLKKNWSRIEVMLTEH